MKEGRGGGKEREAPTHLIKNSKLTHAVRVTKYSKRIWLVVDSATASMYLSMRTRTRTVRPVPTHTLALASMWVERLINDHGFHR